MNQEGKSSTGRVNLSVVWASVLGFLANALVLLTFVLAIYLCLAVLGLVYTSVDAFARAEQAGEIAADSSALALLGQSAIASAGNAVKGLWDVRLGFIIFGVLGLFAAWAERAASRVNREHAWLGSLICLGVILTVSAITFVVAERGELAVWISDTPEMFRWRDFYLESQSFDVFVGLIVALTVTYPMWAVWRWWYTRLTGCWLARVSPLTSGGQPDVDSSPASSPWQGRQLVKLLTLLLVPCMLLLYPVSRYHDDVAMEIQHGRVFVDAMGGTQRQAAFVLTVGAEANRVRVVNINGQGIVDLHVSRGEDLADPVASVTDWAFERRASTSEHYYEDLPLEGVEPGEYTLHFVQQEGWGSYEYALSHGGGPASHALALAFGFLLACSIVLGVALVLLLVGRRLGWPVWEGQDGLKPASGSTV